MKKRILTSAALALALAALMAATVFWPPALDIMLFVLTLVGIYECVSACSVGRARLEAAASFSFALAFWLLIRLGLSEYLWVCVSAYAVLFIVSAVIAAERKGVAASHSCAFAVFTVYITVGFSAQSLLFAASGSPAKGLLLVLSVLLGAWFCDIGGWVFGVFAGRHRLCPNISPKKTVEGLAGSVVFSEVFYISIALISRAAAPQSPLRLGLFAALAPLAALCELAGDLFASILKRESGIKDYGTLFPGHGGVMDRFDGVLMNGLLFLILSRFISFFGGAV